MAAIANRYARALAEVSVSQKTHPVVARELDQLGQLLLDHPELKNFFDNPAIPAAKKKAAATDLLAKLQFCVTSRNFVFVLIDNYRIHIFGEILQAFHQALNEQLGIVQANITASARVDPAMQARLASRLESLTGKKVLLKFSTDEALIGGVITRIGDTIYDGSVRQQLSRIKAQLSSQ